MPIFRKRCGLCRSALAYIETSTGRSTVCGHCDLDACDYERCGSCLTTAAEGGEALTKLRRTPTPWVLERWRWTLDPRLGKDPEQ